jgi:hypothetical protein
MVWVAVSFAAVVFLCWFGNYTAEKFRRLYGTLPAVKEPSFSYGSPEPEYEMADNVMMSSCVSLMTAVASPYYLAPRRRR